MEIHKIEVDGCKKAWRYSEPEPCDPPKINYKKLRIPRQENYLISFYDLLAMIQTECFMRQYVQSKRIIVSTSEMKSLEWLHEYIRNTYEHFIPKSYLAPLIDLITVSIICLDKGNKLIFESGNVIRFDIPKNIKRLIEINYSKLQKLYETEKNKIKK